MAATERSGRRHGWLLHGLKRNRAESLPGRIIISTAFDAAVETATR